MIILYCRFYIISDLPFNMTYRLRTMRNTLGGHSASDLYKKDDEATIKLPNWIEGVLF